MSGKLERKLRKLGLVVRNGSGSHRVVLDPDGRKILGVFPTTSKGQSNVGRAHKNLRATIKRETGIDIDA